MPSNCAPPWRALSGDDALAVAHGHVVPGAVEQNGARPLGRLDDIGAVRLPPDVPDEVGVVHARRNFGAEREGDGHVKGQLRVADRQCSRSEQHLRKRGILERVERGAVDVEDPVPVEREPHRIVEPAQLGGGAAVADGRDRLGHHQASFSDGPGYGLPLKWRHAARHRSAHPK
eukprot:6190315-Pleurochrysis_carterae.AAC.2